MLLRSFLLAFAVTASAAFAGVLGYAAFLLAWGSAHDDAMAVPYFYLVVIVAGTPTVLACGATWFGYRAVTRRSRRLPK